MEDTILKLHYKYAQSFASSAPKLPPPHLLLLVMSTHGNKLKLGQSKRGVSSITTNVGSPAA